MSVIVHETVSENCEFDTVRVCDMACVCVCVHRRDSTKSGDAGLGHYSAHFFVWGVRDKERGTELGGDIERGRE